MSLLALWLSDVAADPRPWALAITLGWVAIIAAFPVEVDQDDPMSKRAVRRHGGSD